MKNKLPLVLILFAILSISFISLAYAETPLYGKNGMLVYKDHIIKRVCYPFMPCSIVRINTPSLNYNSAYNNANKNINNAPDCDPDSPPGFFRIFSPNYDPAYNRYPCTNAPSGALYSEIDKINRQNLDNSNYNLNIYPAYQYMPQVSNLPSYNSGNNYNPNSNVNTYSTPMSNYGNVYSY